MTSQNTNQKCILHCCDSCPDESFVRDFLVKQLQNNNYSPSDSIKYKLSQYRQELARG